MPKKLLHDERNNKPCKRHRWYVWSWTHARKAENAQIHFQCQKCKAQYSRKVTAAEAKFYSEYVSLRDWLRPNKKKRGIHTVFQDFCKRFEVRTKTGETKIGKKKVNLYKESWRWKGFKMMEHVEKWAEKWPDDVQITSVDDDHYCGSMVVFIEHKAPDAYHGTTLVYIPQCTGEDPIRFFLYPGHHQGIVKALAIVKERSLPSIKGEAKATQKRYALQHKLITLPDPTFQVPIQKEDD
jgi:hypothetical protein